MSAATSARSKVGEELRSVAQPDSRFHFRFSEVIPDFSGSAEAIEHLAGTDFYRRSRHVFVTPDNSLIELRRRLLVEGVSLVMSSYNMARGFFLMRPESVPKGQELFAAWLDGLEHFGEPVTLRQLAELGPLDMMVTGALAVSNSGVRFGRGHGFFDLEWRIFSAMGLVNERTPIATVVHDVQLLEQPLYPSSEDVLVDCICTPTRLIDVQREMTRPRGLVWEEVAPEQIEAVPALRELSRAVGVT